MTESERKELLEGVEAAMADRIINGVEWIECVSVNELHEITGITLELSHGRPVEMDETSRNCVGFLANIGIGFLLEESLRGKGRSSR